MGRDVRQHDASSPPPGGSDRLTGRRQVFGLAGGRRVCRWTYWSSLPSSREPVRNDDGRSRLPLRGSPGFTPGSLLSPSRTRAGYRRSASDNSRQPDFCQEGRADLSRKRHLREAGSRVSECNSLWTRAPPFGARRSDQVVDFQAHWNDGRTGGGRERLRFAVRPQTSTSVVRRDEVGVCIRDSSRGLAHPCHSPRWRCLHEH